MKSPAMKSLAVVVVLLAAMTWAKARSTANVVGGAQYAATSSIVGGGGGGSLDLPTGKLPLTQVHRGAAAVDHECQIGKEHVFGHAPEFETGNPCHGMHQLVRHRVQERVHI